LWSRDELEPFYAYERSRTKLGNKHHAVSLTDMAEITEHLFFQRLWPATPGRTRLFIFSAANEKWWGYIGYDHLTTVEKETDRAGPHSDLLTYRDPLHSRGGPLGADEEELRESSLKDYFLTGRPVRT
jgi:hypothetical protein